MTATKTQIHLYARGRLYMGGYYSDFGRVAKEAFILIREGMGDYACVEWDNGRVILFRRESGQTVMRWADTDEVLPNTPWA
jgi:hypothetical protein